MNCSCGGNIQLYGIYRLCSNDNCIKSHRLKEDCEDNNDTAGNNQSEEYELSGDFNRISKYINQYSIGDSLRVEYLRNKLSWQMKQIN